MSLIDREISLGMQLYQYHTYVDFTPFLLHVLRVFVLRIAAVHVRRTWIFAARWNFVISAVESKAVLSCQNNAESACHERTFIHTILRTWTGSGKVYAFVLWVSAQITF